MPGFFFFKRKKKKKKRRRRRKKKKKERKKERKKRNITGLLGRKSLSRPSSPPFHFHPNCQGPCAVGAANRRMRAVLARSDGGRPTAVGL